MLNLFDPRTGTPRAILDATVITDMRTGAVTAIGAKHLRAQESQVLGHIGARGTAYWNVRLLDHLFDFDEIRVHSRRPESRDALRRKLSRRSRQAGQRDRRTGRAASRAPTSSSRPRGCRRPQPLLRTEWIKPGALVVPYGTMSAVELSLTDIMDKIVVDDWGQCKGRQVRRAARPCRDRPAEREHAACRTRPDRRRPQARARERRRDDPVLASRPVAVRHRARQGDAGQGAAARHRPEAALSMTADGQHSAAFVANARTMYAVDERVAALWDPAVRLDCGRRAVFRSTSSRMRRHGRSARSGGAPSPIWGCAFHLRLSRGPRGPSGDCFDLTLLRGARHPVGRALRWPRRLLHRHCGSRRFASCGRRRIARLAFRVYGRAFAKRVSGPPCACRGPRDA